MVMLKSFQAIREVFLDGADKLPGCEVLQTVKIILDEARKETLRADRAWELFFESKSSLRGRARLAAFANWLWDELGR